MPKCLLCNSVCANFAKSHILSKGFFNNVDAKKQEQCQGRAVNLKTGDSRKLASSIYDLEMLCPECEDKIMKPLDNYGIKVLRDKNKANRINFVNDLGLWVYDELDKRQLRAFIASVLWRCSVSRLKELAKISIGAVYEQRIGHDLLNGGEFDYIDAQTFFLTDILHNAFSLPYKKKYEPRASLRDSHAVNGWRLEFPKITLLVSLDKRPHPYRVYWSLSPEFVGGQDGRLGRVDTNRAVC